MPAPVGETGGGFAHAILGSVKLLLLACSFGIPIGFLGGVYLAEFGGTIPAFIIRYTTDLLNGVPSIVMGIFAYRIVVVQMGHFSTLAGGLALGAMMIPIPRGGVLQDVRGLDAAKSLENIEDVVISARIGQSLVPLPEGSLYLGFIFARAETPDRVEATLRAAHQRIEFEIGI